MHWQHIESLFATALIKNIYALQDVFFLAYEKTFEYGLLLCALHLLFQAVVEVYLKLRSVLLDVSILEIFPSE